MEGSSSPPNTSRKKRPRKNVLDFQPKLPEAIPRVKFRRRQARGNEYMAVLERWRSRTLDLRDEKDYGDSILHQLPDIKRRKVIAPSEPQIQDPQTQIVDALLQERENRAPDQDDPDDDPRDYWELGYATGKTNVTPKLSLPGEKQRRQDKDERNAFTLKGFAGLHPSKKKKPLGAILETFHASWLTHSTPTHMRYTHRDFLLRAAARFQDPAALAVLWKMPNNVETLHVDSYPNRIRGCLMHFFCSYTWTDPYRALRDLYLLPEMDPVFNCYEPSQHLSRLALFLVRMKQTYARKTNPAQKKRQAIPNKEATVVTPPDTKYIYVPCSTPPVPTFPMKLPFLFGPTDRCEYVHYRPVIPESVYRMTIDALDRPRGVAVLEKVVELCSSNLYKQLNRRTRHEKLEVPLLHLAQAVETAIGFLAAADTSWLDRAEALHDFLEERHKHNGLLFFSRVQIVWGVLEICRVFPSEDVCQALAEPSDGNPIDRIRTALDYVEVIEDDQAGTLEFQLYQIAQHFEIIKDRDPTEPDHYCWHLGVLAMCLLLDSGNRIGDRARRFPSEHELPHEVRPALAKFQEMREAIVVHLRTLTEFAFAQRSNRAYEALASFLGWRQVMGLVLGDSGWYDDACQLHARCLYEQRLLDTAPHELLRSHRLEALAGDLELDPRDLLRWSRLVHALGPVDWERRWENPDRHGWWADTLLRSSAQWKKDLGRHWKEIHKRLQEMESCVPILRSSVPSLTVNDGDDDSFMFEWIDGLECELVEYQSQSKKARRKTVDHLLPGEEWDEDDGLVDRSFARDLHVAVYKMIVLVHLYGLDHRAIKNAILHLIGVSCNDHELQADSYMSLVFLIRFRIPVAHLFQHYALEEFPPEPPRKPGAGRPRKQRAQEVYQKQAPLRTIKEFQTAIDRIVAE